MRNRVTALALAVSLLAAAVRADEFKLKDGNKISGTIVGFDDNSFRVQTSYGFAMIRKDQIVSITVSDANAAKAAAPAATATAPPAALPATGNDKRPDGSQERKPAPAGPAKSTDTANTESAANSAPRAAVTSPLPSRAASAEPTLTSKPPEPAAPPEPIRETVEGNTYTNLTYGFRMYKPPGWEVIEGARSLMPGAITAMGTLDQTTYLLIGEVPAGQSLKNDVDTADQRLRGLMENFRALGESHITVSGAPGVERKFRGSIDQKDWSGTVVYVSRGGQLYTIFGMTIADTDLVQIQENVIARAIASLQFVP